MEGLRARRVSALKPGSGACRYEIRSAARGLGDRLRTLALSLSDGITRREIQHAPIARPALRSRLAPRLPAHRPLDARVQPRERAARLHPEHALGEVRAGEPVDRPPRPPPLLPRGGGGPRT